MKIRKASHKLIDKAVDMLLDGENIGKAGMAVVAAECYDHANGKSDRGMVTALMLKMARSTEGGVDALIDLYNKAYETLYNNDGQTEHDTGVKGLASYICGQALCEMDPELYQAICQKRGDALTSDRELTAYFLAVCITVGKFVSGITEDAVKQAEAAACAG